MRRILALCFFLAIPSVALAQHPTDEDFTGNLMRLQDDTDRTKSFIVKADGTYFTNASPFRIESFGRIQKHGCSVTVEETTPFYRMVMAGDSCKGTGKVVVQLFGVGNFSILDRVRD